MSFGRPGGLSDNFKASPPLRGSFPLDHDGECKAFMVSYMKCLKENKNNSGACRLEARGYLGCRMDNQLMDREEWTNLGLGDVTEKANKSAPSESAKTTNAASGTGGASASNTGSGGSSGSRWVPSERI
ncbi:hypothetical protein CcaverHIS002_0204230 [Cutaneotrichosporon cavernicola]|uniref:CHCH domain-containing protein n=1 Tax=Cutaneotrichosporon cavernicola TaxID=279322 RepID=A0AA48IIF3_9TREE|nr:uncharacterized protein CcaverHIS019_0204200 [Cutaneotrichosporon cavernicola]BEI81263.1 hypothetical protein CcaverHIS002_0204230 [Cutaneotrichosporon cavernicola]BEI89058.1 hypothetical protein CcaverHIS019_0204200 [Cutaneotrichosporon cavernicola]BEI96834.1 hypothetical protein CcaverHIS631_0204230 [Cutaneotrichosporon cavernicola]BEJ04606.1 hypothetical protein CcaverHIS641_0204230 [Cutaneotrichosporon cavernicola]